MSGYFRQREDGELVRIPVTEGRHSPVEYLYYQGKHIGFRCLHCNLYLTPSGQPSSVKLVRNPPHSKPGVVRVVDNKAHEARVAVGTKSIMQKLRDTWTSFTS